MGPNILRAQSRVRTETLSASAAKAQQYITAGYRWMVDLDLEKFFDRVNHDRLMAALSRRVTDKRASD